MHQIPMYFFFENAILFWFQIKFMQVIQDGLESEKKIRIQKLGGSPQDTLFLENSAVSPNFLMLTCCPTFVHSIGQNRNRAWNYMVSKLRQTKEKRRRETFILLVFLGDSNVYNNPQNLLKPNKIKPILEGNLFTYKKNREKGLLL